MMKCSTVFLLSLVTLSFLAFGLSQGIPAPNDNLNIFAVPVGQGDSTVIQCPKQPNDVQEIAIIDAGTTRARGFDKSDYKNFIAGQRVSNVILTHPNKDHVGYVDMIYESLEQDVLPPLYHSCPIKKYEKHIKNLHALAVERQILFCCGKAACNQEIKMCGGKVSIHIIASALSACLHGGDNGDSVITLLEYRHKCKVNSFLGMGDYEDRLPDINTFLQCAGNDIKATLLRLAHHGSAGTSNIFANHYKILDAVEAQYVFSSSGAIRTYKHPNCQIYDYYHKEPSSLATVSNHDYQCFNDSQGVFDWADKQTTKAIYTTTFQREGADGEDAFTNQFLQFYVGQDTNGFVNDIGGIAVKHVDITQPCSCSGGHVQQKEMIQSTFDHATEENEENEYISEYNSNADMQYEGSDQRTEGNGDIMEPFPVNDEGFEDDDGMMRV